MSATESPGRFEFAKYTSLTAQPFIASEINHSDRIKYDIEDALLRNYSTWCPSHKAVRFLKAL
jgi:hypothetical protein